MADGRATNLSRHNILVIEDELLVAMDLEDTLADQGYTVVASAPTIGAAHEALATCDVDVAILDLNLDGELAFSVAEELAAREIPFVIVSGYGELQSFHPALASAPLVAKPWNRKHLLDRVSTLLAAASHSGRGEGDK